MGAVHVTEPVLCHFPFAVVLSDNLLHSLATSSHDDDATLASVGPHALEVEALCAALSRLDGVDTGRCLLGYGESHAVDIECHGVCSRSCLPCCRGFLHICLLA